MRVVSSIALAALVLAAADSPAAAAQESHSAAPAAELVKLMEAKGLDAFAVADSREAGRYIAVLCVPGSELLVVSAKYPAPKALDDLIAKRQFRDVYMDLQGPAASVGRFFVQDMQADGLEPRPARHEGMDIVYEGDGSAARFDGDWHAQGLTEGDYQAKFEAADGRYASMLSALAAALSGPQ